MWERIIYGKRADGIYHWAEMKERRWQKSRGFVDKVERIESNGLFCEHVIPAKSHWLYGRVKRLMCSVGYIPF